MTDSVRLAATGCLTAFGDTEATLGALLRGDRALQLTPVLGREGGESVPLALVPGRSLDETAPPNWFPLLRALAATIPSADGRDASPRRPLPASAAWGTARHPVFVTSSNFGVGSLYAFQRTRDAAHLGYGTPHLTVEAIARDFGWGPNVTTLSHACVSAHLGLLLATRALAADIADRALVFSFDFLSPFVAGGFHSLKILNAHFPAPYADRPTGSIGLGDGAAFAVLERTGTHASARGGFTLSAQTVFNEMHHFTANRPDGSGFAACLAPVRAAADGRRVWLKGHGTGTLEAGRLESAALAGAFPDAPLVSWKGSLGHTLGSCGLVELAIAAAAIRRGRAPGTVGSAAPTFTPQVALEPFDLAAFDGVVCASNAFGGAHGAFLLSHA